MAQHYVIRLHPGQDLKKALAAFAKTKNLRAAWIVTAVGSLTTYQLRFANQQEGYSEQGHFEIVSLTGALSADSMHVHMSVSDSTGRTVGGHLLDGNIVYTTVELVIGATDNLEFSREIDTTYGYRELVVKPKQ
ncbi:MAG: PPC domain-containing DNA-binding protein [Saprospiraceae bacterium]